MNDRPDSLLPRGYVLSGVTSLWMHPPTSGDMATDSRWMSVEVAHYFFCWCLFLLLIDLNGHPHTHADRQLDARAPSVLSCPHVRSDNRAGTKLGCLDFQGTQ